MVGLPRMGGTVYFFLWVALEPFKGVKFRGLQRLTLLAVQSRQPEPQTPRPGLSCAACGTPSCPPGLSLAERLQSDKPGT